MAPADSKDWLFAAVALTSAVTTPAVAAPSDQAGVVTGVLSSTRAAPSGQTNNTTVVLGDVVRAGEAFHTGPDGVIHILFLDQSSITLAPNSSLTVEKFTHDPQTRSGKIDLLLTTGNVRVVGGLNSKTNPTQIRTPDAKVEILGGISLVSTSNSGTQSTFLFGQQMRVSNPSGTQTVTRPGFSVSSGNGGPSSPQRLSPQQLSQMTNALQSPPSTNAGANPPPQAPAPGGPLIATSDVRGGQQSGAPAAIAGDRLNSSNSTLVGAVMSNNRPDAINPSSDTTTLRGVLSAQTIPSS